MSPTVNHGAPTWGTLSDAAEHLKLSQRTVRRMISAGRIVARRYGGQIRVDMSTLDDAGDIVGVPR